MLGGNHHGVKNDHCHRACSFHHRRADLSESQKPEEVTSLGRPCGAAPFTYPKKKGVFADERTI